MESIIYFLVWAAFIFIMMRFGCGAHVMGHGHKGKHNHDKSASHQTDYRWEPPEKDTDPVCGKTVSTDKAKSSVYDGIVYYFCSRECREVFEAMPETYVTENRNQQTQQVEHSHG